MSMQSYLPSMHFTTIVGSIGLAGLLILTAQYVTSPKPLLQLSTSQYPQQPQQDWRAALEAIEATQAPLPTAPSEDKVQTLLAAAQSGNLTDTVARSLLVNLSDASAQGLGSDIPTQEQLITQALNTPSSTTAKKTYTTRDLRLVDPSITAQHTYGNAVMTVLGRHTGATSQATLYAIALASDMNDPATLDALVGIEHDYQAIVDELASTPVPSTLAPLHVQALNDLGLIAASVRDLQKLFSDPLLALQGLQRYQQLLGETGRVFTAIATQFNKNGILFTKDEPGAAWAVLLSSQ